MKKLVLLLAIAGAFTACKKEETAPATEETVIEETTTVEEVPAPPADAPAEAPANNN